MTKSEKYYLHSRIDNRNTRIPVNIKFYKSKYFRVKL